MAAKLLTIGAGDVGGCFARLLGGTGAVDRLVLAGLCRGAGPFSAGMLSSGDDLRAGFVEPDAAHALQTRSMAGDGIAAIADHGTVTDTGAGGEAMGAIDPELTEPLGPDGPAGRFHHLTAAVARQPHRNIVSI